MLFSKRQRATVNAVSRRAFRIVSVLLVLVAILNQFDFSGVDTVWLIVWGIFTACWVAAAGIAAKRRWLPFRWVALFYWGAAFASGLLRLLMEALRLDFAGELLGFPQYLLTRLPLNAVILAASAGEALTKATVVAGLLYFALVMVVFYVILWRNEKLLLD